MSACLFLVVALSLASVRCFTPDDGADNYGWSCETVESPMHVCAVAKTECKRQACPSWREFARLAFPQLCSASPEDLACTNRTCRRSRGSIARSAVTIDHLFDESWESKLQDLASEHAKPFQEARPFPHIVIDDFLPTDVLRVVARELQELPECAMIQRCVSKTWECWDSSYERAKYSPLRAGVATELLLMSLQRLSFVRFLETLTGISPLIPDPHRYGGGVHITAPGGFLQVHSDFSKHPLLKLHRRVNVFIYFNDDWEEDWGGHLELWGKSGSEKRILPTANRFVVFAATPQALHGHPRPLACPPHRARRSLALYFYSPEPAHADFMYSSTMWLDWGPEAWQGGPAPAPDS